MLAELEAWHALRQLEVELDEHVIDLRSFVKAFNQRTSNIHHLASAKDQYHNATLMFLDGFGGGESRLEDFLKGTKYLHCRISPKEQDCWKESVSLGVLVTGLRCSIESETGDSGGHLA